MCPQNGVDNFETVLNIKTINETVFEAKKAVRLMFQNLPLKRTVKRHP
jgi:hypothetical protein